VIDEWAKKWVPAPQSYEQTTGNCMLGVYLGQNERVEWIYTFMPDGSRIVTGYNILPLLPKETVELLNELP